MNKTIKIELSKQDLDHIYNDVLSYTLDRKVCVTKGRAYNHSVYEDIEITPVEREELKALGVYDRINLLKRIEEVRKNNFPECPTTNS